MTVRVYPPPFADLRNLDNQGRIELPDGARLRDLYRALAIPAWLRPVPMCLVNYEWARPRRELFDGDTVSFFLVGQGG